MKERGIIFSGPMVRAILEDRKTQTRRVMKNPPTLMDKVYAKLFRRDFGGRRCPYGVAGDKLYVREAWADLPQHPFHCIAYRASCDNDEFDYRHKYGTIERLKVEKWKPSIHMPKRYTRIWLEITGVRVERLQDISEEDAKAEGVERWFPQHESLRKADEEFKRKRGEKPGSYRNGFHSLWDSLNKKRGYGWKQNPWVWVICFKRIDAPA